MAHCENCSCPECIAFRTVRTNELKGKVENSVFELARDNYFRKRGPRVGLGVIRVRSIVIEYDYIPEKATTTQKRHTIKCHDTGGPMEWKE